MKQGDLCRFHRDAFTTTALTSYNDKFFIVVGIEEKFFVNIFINDAVVEGWDYWTLYDRSKEIVVR